MQEVGSGAGVTVLVVHAETQDGDGVCLREVFRDSAAEAADDGVFFDGHEAAGFFCSLQKQRFVGRFDRRQVDDAHMDAVRCMLGQDNISAMQPEELTARFQAEQLMGRLAMLADDASSSTINEGLKAIMKRLSAGNVLHTDVKHYPGCEFVPYCTMLISWNRFPKVSSSDFGFMRRLVPVPFMHTFRKTDPDYDSTIRDSLREEQAQERLLVHAVEGLRRLIRQDQPTGNHAADLLKAEIEAEGDSVYSWMEDEGIEQDSLIGQRTSDVYGRYKGYCEANGIEKPDDARWFGRKVKARLDLKTVKCTAKGSQYREYAPAG